MKNLFKTTLFSIIATIFSVPAIVAAPENHEEFVRQYMPETQAVFERFRKESNETKELCIELESDLKKLNREFYDDAAHCAIVAKIEL